ncbi:glutamate--cysteine ligase [Streptomyces lateritius]|uniref:Putative glutamate--cysteine ligase 2 n=1 Tax=Streptomyces lateritius TaxID=67313 RepID=A0ABW6YHV4_9ACTN
MEILTMGVEEEFMLVDPVSRAPVDRAPTVIGSAAAELGGQVQAEFFNAQVEVCTQPTVSCRDLRGELARLRGTVGAAAAAADCLLVASGTPVVPREEPLTVTDTARYRHMARAYATSFNRYDGLVCGCHVHVGTLDRARALKLANHMRPWLPVLQSLAGNSPFSRGRDSGFASRRSVEFGRWPTAGPAPVLDEDRYLALVTDLVGGGTLLDRKMIYWHARPSEHVPTLEVRIADVNADLDMVVLLAALVRGLAVTLLDDVDADVPPPDVPLGRLLAAHAHAASLGMSGEGFDPESGEPRPARDLVERLLLRAAPGLETAGDAALVDGLWRTVRRGGNGAVRQRAIHERHGRLSDVVDALAAVTAAA